MAVSVDNVSSGKVAASVAVMQNRQVHNSVLMIGLDFGSTTSRALIARSRISRNRLTGYLGLDKPEIVYRAEPVLTPFVQGVLQPDDIMLCLDRWFSECGIKPAELFSGGVILTGFAAEEKNATAIAQAVKQRVQNLIVATADDPSLESWLAFMGNSQEISFANPESLILNLDIGGGTTNPALGLNGHVCHTGCCQIGARHFQFVPGTYQLAGISALGLKLADFFGFSAEIGQEISLESRNQILNVFVSGLKALASGNADYFNTIPGQWLQKVPFLCGFDGDVAVTYSGGIGELLYRYVEGKELPETTCYGDLGIDLAKAILAEPVLTESIQTHIPEFRGQSTVYGLAMHSAEISGHTIFLPNPALLPLHDLPVVARLSLKADKTSIEQSMSLVRKCQSGGAIQITPDAGGYPELADIRQFGSQIATQLEQQQFPAEHPLLLLVPQDFGKVIGNYATRWGRLSATVMVIDEIPDRPAQFVSLGAVKDYVIPVYFYGMH